MEHESFLGFWVIDFAQSDLVGQRRTRRRVAHHLDAIAAQNLLDPRHTAFATARTHAHAGDVLQLIDGDELAVANHVEESLQINVLAVANVGLFRQNGLVIRLELDGFRVSVFQDETSRICQFRIPHSAFRIRFHAHHMGLVFLLQHLFNHAFAHGLAVVVDEEHFFAFFYVILDGQEQRVFVEVVAKDGQARTVVHALHTADALVVIDHRSGIGRSLGDGVLRAAERAGIAGEAKEAVQLHERFGLHALLGGQVGLFQNAHRMLLRINVLS